ncbi:hypothetical protein KEM52_000152 [Ascosphaera acerosa]|nr:hypothetical protein KEM52_000152 [Ascosphaera acerosa]
MRAPSTTYGSLRIDSTSDDIDEVNLLKAELAGSMQDYGAGPGHGPDRLDKDGMLGASRFDQGKDKTLFRRYEAACARVRGFYREQHTKQTVAFNLKARNDFRAHVRAEMSVWAAIETLDQLQDESDPDTELSQIEHLLQAAEAMRRDGKPRWMQLTGLIHDLGKLLYFFGAEGQWAVVGDTFPVGCDFDDRNVYGKVSFRDNPDFDHEVYGTKYGIYHPGCGLENVMLAWGHDEYLYHVVKDQSLLPREALAMIRFHSFYPWHSAGAYRGLMNEEDERLLQVVKAFNPYDLYSKSDERPDVAALKPYYLDLIDEFFPKRVIKW